MSLLIECQRIRNDPAPDMERMRKFFAMRDGLISRTPMGDYLEWSPIQWPRKWSCNSKEEIEGAKNHRSGNRRIPRK